MRKMLEKVSWGLASTFLVLVFVIAILIITAATFPQVGDLVSRMYHGDEKHEELKRERLEARDWLLNDLLGSTVEVTYGEEVFFLRVTNLGDDEYLNHDIEGILIIPQEWKWTYGFAQFPEDGVIIHWVKSGSTYYENSGFEFVDNPYNYDLQIGRITAVEVKQH